MSSAIVGRSKLMMSWVDVLLEMRTGVCDDKYEFVFWLLMQYIEWLVVMSR